MSAGAVQAMRRALRDELEVHRAAIVRIERALAQQPDEDELLGTKAAAYIWGRCENTALRRMRKIGRKGLDGRWLAPRSVIEARTVQDGVGQ